MQAKTLFIAHKEKTWIQVHFCSVLAAKLLMTLNQKNYERKKMENKTKHLSILDEKWEFFRHISSHTCNTVFCIKQSKLKSVTINTSKYTTKFKIL